METEIYMTKREMEKYLELTYKNHKYTHHNIPPSSGSTSIEDRIEKLEKDNDKLIRNVKILQLELESLKGKMDG